MSAPDIFCVLRSGGDFSASDVEALVAQIQEHAPARSRIYCLSDVEVPCARVPIRYNWPGWWSKMELFRPDLVGDIFYIDLDTVIVGDLGELMTQTADTMLDDFFYPLRPASGLMYITQRSKLDVWMEWTANIKRVIDRCGSGGDQMFLSRIDFGKNSRRWQQDFPGQVVSYKAHMIGRNGRAPLAAPPINARMVCFHGKPRPKNVKEKWVTDARAPRTSVPSSPASDVAAER
jgi:hypothetical protein